MYLISISLELFDCHGVGPGEGSQVLTLRWLLVALPAAPRSALLPRGVRWRRAAARNYCTACYGALLPARLCADLEPALMEGAVGEDNEARLPPRHLPLNLLRRR